MPYVAFVIKEPGSLMEPIELVDPYRLSDAMSACRYQVNQGAYAAIVNHVSDRGEQRCEYVTTRKHGPEQNRLRPEKCMLQFSRQQNIDAQRGSPPGRKRNTAAC